MKFISALSIAAFAGASALYAVSAPATAQTMPSCASGDPVVWENTSSKVYHLKGDKYFGNTKHGSYACKSAADGAGYHGAQSSSKHGAASAASASAAPDAADSATPATAMTTKHHRRKKSGSASPAPAPTGT